MKQKRLTWDIILSHFTSVKSKNQEREGGGGRGSVVQSRCLIKKRRRGVMEGGDDGACLRARGWFFFLRFNYHSWNALKVVF